ncbi:GNAT family N-acetyltransferase [Kribbella sp. NBC_00709]|uniref:GNAT family N-acetyltransferase n=1 Tax=Kribbella sp. NBC_00709 TaxID=2975972 RepID=UPI002E27AE39|nr:GNAT family protein [Kribbella sp. NBC_00709]
MTMLGALPCVEGQVRVRTLEYGDAAAYALGSKDESVKRHGHLPISDYTEDIVREQIDGDIAAGLADGSLAVLAIADVGSDEFLGSIVLFNVRADRAEVGFWLAPWGRGRGAARDALAAAARLAARLGLTVLDARTSPDNQASQRTLLSAGYRQVGEPEAVTAPSGEVFTALKLERSVVEFGRNG